MKVLIRPRHSVEIGQDGQVIVEGEQVPARAVPKTFRNEPMNTCDNGSAVAMTKYSRQNANVT